MGRRHSVFGFAVLALVFAASGCQFNTTPPPGDAPLRYRDEIFTVTKRADINYGSGVNSVTGVTEQLMLDLYGPTGDSVKKPAIVWVHGGSFFDGDKTSPEIVDEANSFARKGYLNVSINYRMSTSPCPGTSSSEQINCIRAIGDAQHDAQTAVRFLRSNSDALGVDPDRIAIGGSSAGAITALNVGFNSEDTGIPRQPSSAVKAAVSLSGFRGFGTLDASDAPSLLFHGTADQVVPFSSAQKTQSDASAAGLVSYLTVFDQAGHVPYAAHRTQIINETTNFLWWTLDDSNAAK
jgi:para-nitrobenzyl esterase